MGGKKRMRIRPFRLLAFCLAATALFLLIRLPACAVDAEERLTALQEASDAYYAAQAENRRIQDELSRVDTPEFIERTARREYGYCWYGETIYEVSNLEELLPKADFERYEADAGENALIDGK